MLTRISPYHVCPFCIPPFQSHIEIPQLFLLSLLRLSIIAICSFLLFTQLLSCSGRARGPVGLPNLTRILTMVMVMVIAMVMTRITVIMMTMMISKWPSPPFPFFSFSFFFSTVLMTDNLGEMIQLLRNN